MGKPLTILFDLDGTLTNTNPPEFRPYRDGLEDISIREVPVFDGAREVVGQLQEDGHQVFIVSDSHPRFVGPIARDIFGVAYLDLAYKPAVDKTKAFLAKHSNHRLDSARSRIFVIGDSTLDIELARRLRIPSVHIMHHSAPDFDRWAATQKIGATFSCKNFTELRNILNDPLSNLLAIEGLPYSDNTWRAIMLEQKDYRASVGRRLFGRALARQETGLCDVFGKADWYHIFGSEDRTKDFLKKIGAATARFIQAFSKNRGVSFDMLSYVPDKSTTIPPNKMKEFAHHVEAGMPVRSLLTWDDNVEGSIRNRHHRRDRVKFVKQFVKFSNEHNVRGKNIVVVDDQLTTGATMDAVADILWEYGAQDILFIALFRMIDEVKTGKKCPQCNKEMSIRTRRRDGNQFYSCVPKKYGGVGCGYIENI